MAWINVDYYFYTDMFKGTVIPESTFDRKIIESEAFINKITFGRIHKYALRPDDLKAVKFAIYKNVEVENKQEAINYEKMASYIVAAFIRAGIRVGVDERDFGRLMGEIIGT